MRYAFGVVILFVAASPAMACLNDTQVRQAEEQFRSGYERAPEQPMRLRNFYGVDLLGIGAAVAGGGMISLAVYRARKNGTKGGTDVE
jgi:hypothetical protein